jgi:hypothetical protein
VKHFCPCQKQISVCRDNLLREFIKIRLGCPVLRELIIPDNYLDTFLEIASSSPDIVRHTYKAVGSLQLGILGKMTYPIHRYLFDGAVIKKSVSSNYKKDLSETWMDQNDTLSRHQKARIHDGKFVELHCASLLEDMGWKIDNLSALGGEFDIEATDSEGIEYSIEVKYIGTQDAYFKDIEKSCITNNAVAGTIPIYDGFNFFLFKIFEASSQLSIISNKKKIAIIVFSSHAWSFNEMPIIDNWINRNPIEFSINSSCNWHLFLNEKLRENKFKNINQNLNEVIKSIDFTFVIKKDSLLNFTLEKVIENKILN